MWAHRRVDKVELSSLLDPRVGGLLPIDENEPATGNEELARATASSSHSAPAHVLHEAGDRPRRWKKKPQPITQERAVCPSRLLESVPPPVELAVEADECGDQVLAEVQSAVVSLAEVNPAVGPNTAGDPRQEQKSVTYPADAPTHQKRFRMRQQQERKYADAASEEVVLTPFLSIDTFGRYTTSNQLSTALRSVGLTEHAKDTNFNMRMAVRKIQEWHNMTPGELQHFCSLMSIYGQFENLARTVMGETFCWPPRAPSDFMVAPHSDGGDVYRAIPTHDKWHTQSISNDDPSQLHTHIKVECKVCGAKQFATAEDAYQALRCNCCGASGAVRMEWESHNDYARRVRSKGLPGPY